MRAMNRVTLGALAAISIACGGGGDGGSGPPATSLVGTWNATKVEFTSKANPTQKVDVIAQGATMTLVLNGNGTYDQTMKVPGQPDDITNGTWSTSGGIFTMQQAGMPFSWQFSVSLSGNTLTLSGADVEFDVNNDGTDEPAKLTTVLVR
jgi:hypothetical protein